MSISRILLPLGAVALAATLIVPTDSVAFSINGFVLDLGQRDFRIFNNFGDPTANDNVTSVGNTDSNTHSEISGCGGGVIAFMEGPSTNG